jgi:Cu(I)/Ag(I) efflux system membrane protein CusA/SilA
VDAAIVMIENAHKRLEHAPPGASRSDTLIKAAIEVGPALFFSLLVITVSFAPVFTLEAQEGRLFKPLVYTYTFSLAAAALLSVTLVPVLMQIFVRGRIVPERRLSARHRDRASSSQTDDRLCRRHPGRFDLSHNEHRQ